MAADASSILGAAEAVARHEPDRPALIRDGLPISYGALLRQVRGVAAQVARAGIAPGDAVGVTVADVVGHMVASLALMRLGCRQVSLPPSDPAPLRAALARRLGLVAVVVEARAEAPGDVPLLRPDFAAAAAAPDADMPPPRRGTMVFSTSGTTGQPKLMLAEEEVVAHKAAMLAGLGRVFLHMPSFDGNHSRRLSLRSLMTGGTEVLTGALSARDLARLVARHGVGRVHMAPAAVAALADGLDGAPWPAGTCIVTTGTRVPQPVRQRVERSLGCGLHVLYGTTEAGMISIAGPGEHEGHPDSVGRVLPDVEVVATDEDGRALPPGEDGLLRFRSPGIVGGYLDDPEADARFFDGEWFRPGDVGRLLPGGELLVAGRADDRMTLGIIKIFPAEIEAAAEAFPGLRDCAAFAVPSGALGDIPVLAVVAAEGFDAAALLAHCRARLGLRAPRRVLEVALLPRNASGKVMRRDLAALLRVEDA